jgi:hypothetical protein
LEEEQDEDAKIDKIVVLLYRCGINFQKPFVFDVV